MAARRWLPAGALVVAISAIVGLVGRYLVDGWQWALVAALVAAAAGGVALWVTWSRAGAAGEQGQPWRVGPPIGSDAELAATVTSTLVEHYRRGADPELTATGQALSWRLQAAGADLGPLGYAAYSADTAAQNAFSATLAQVLAQDVALRHDLEAALGQPVGVAPGQPGQLSQPGQPGQSIQPGQPGHAGQPGARAVTVVAVVALVAGLGTAGIARTVRGSEPVRGGEPRSGQARAACLVSPPAPEEPAGQVRLTFTATALGGGEPSDQDMARACELLASRLSAVGLASASVNVSGSAVTLTVPPDAVDRARNVAVGGILLLRPVMAQYPAGQASYPGATPEELDLLRALDCSRPPATSSQPDKIIAACSQDGKIRYVLDKALFAGSEIASARLQRRLRMDRARRPDLHTLCRCDLRQGLHSGSFMASASRCRYDGGGRGPRSPTVR